MAERTVLVCDECGTLEATTVTISVDGRKALKDLCSQHLGDLMEGTRKPKRGRKPGTGNSAPVKRRSTTTANRAKARRRRSKRAETPGVSATA